MVYKEKRYRNRSKEDSDKGRQEHNGMTKNKIRGLAIEIELDRPRRFKKMDLGGRDRHTK